MLSIERGETILVKAPQYEVRIKNGTFAVKTGGETFFELSVRSELQKGEQPDRDEEVLAFDFTETESGAEALWLSRSGLWEKKEYRLTFTEAGFLYRMKVWGQGRVGRLNFFTGAGAERYKGSRYDFSRYFTPVALGGGNEARYFTPVQPGVLDLNYLTPPLLCYPFNLEDIPQWFGLGLAARDGQYNFDSFYYQFHQDRAGGRFSLSTDFLDYTEVKDSWEAPGIVGIPGDSEFTVLQNYSRWHYDSGYCKKREAGNEPFWYGPFFCGWGEQGRMDPEDPFSRANEKDYQTMLKTLEELGLKPAAVIIDDKWQKSYGEALPDPGKWPDFRRFVDEQHEKGRKVVLWFKSWNCEGLPADECVSIWSQPLGADPTNPKYQERLRQTLYKLLSADAGCYNCDGFKIDFANCMPLGKNLRIHEPGVYGIELLKRFFKLMYTCSKAAKPEALINCSCCHPYFAEVTDQGRLHDYCGGLRNSKQVMAFRKKLFSAAMPGVLLDTDSASFSNYRDTMEYMRYAPSLGVPDLYTLSSTPEVSLTQEDWAEIRTLWERYSQSLKSSGAETEKSL